MVVDYELRVPKSLPLKSSLSILARPIGADSDEWIADFLTRSKGLFQATTRTPFQAEAKIISKTITLRPPTVLKRRLSLNPSR